MAVVGKRAARGAVADRQCVDALGALIEALRTIHVSRGDHPWLLLDLTMVQLKAVMLLVQAGGMRSRELADGLGIAPSAATPLVDRLVDQKLATRHDDPGDRRIVWIRPTPKATTVYEKLMQMKRSVLAEVLEGIPAAERQQVYCSITLLLDSAERVLAKSDRAKAG